MTAEFQPLDAETAIWYAYDPSVKVELYSTAIRTDAGVYLVDPIPGGDRQLLEWLGGAAVAGVVLTNANHDRAAGAVSLLVRAPVCRRDAADGAGRAGEMARLRCGPDSPPGLTSICIDGAAPGEVALHCSRGGGTLIVGDALINLGSHRFSFLPAKYCTDHRLMRQSLRQLLAFDFERILFAHGEPIVTRAKEQLVELLTNG
jgi:glyoxylase-like metal-dependent hydrolase (beta-lactamase superfamily II)